MARAYDLAEIEDRAGNKWANALGTLYTDEAATTLATDAYAAASGGSPVTTIVSDASGQCPVYFDTPKSYWIKWSDNGGTAYPAGNPAQARPFTAFVSKEHQAFEPAGDAVSIENVASLTVRDKPWVDPTHPSFGASHTASAADNTTAIQAAVNAAATHGVDVMFTPCVYPNHLLVDGTIDLSSLGTGLTVGTLGDIQGNAGGIRTGVWNVTNDNPIWKIDKTSLPGGGHSFVRLDCRGNCLDARATFYGKIHDCAWYGGGSGTLANFRNSWGWEFTNSFFYASDTSHYSMVFTGVGPAVDVDICYLMDFVNVVFSNGGVRYYQQTSSVAATGYFSFDRCYTENIDSAGSMFEFESGHTSFSNDLYNMHFRRCGMYDPSGTPPLVRMKNGAGYCVGWSFEGCDVGVSADKLVQVDATSYFPFFHGTSIKGMNLGRIVASDGTSDYGAQWGTVKHGFGGHSVAARSDFTGQSDSRSANGSGYAIRKDSDRQFSWTRDWDGTEHYGPGGTGSGLTFDTQVGRGGAGFMYVPMLVKAGVPADGDYVTTPPNGTLAVNSSTNKIYCRIGGTWTQVTA